MRTCTLLLLAVALALVLYLAQFGPGGTPSGVSSGALGPQAALEPVAELAPATQVNGMQALDDLAHPTATSEAKAEGPSSSIPNALEGMVIDRFGAPLGGERVWLIPATHGHPILTVPLDKYITARTSRSGQFSLSLPDAGPWRLAVGPAGEQRIPPSAPRKMESGANAVVTLPGSSRLLIATAEIKQLAAPITIEVLALMEAGDVGAKKKGRGAESNSKGKRQDSEREKSRGQEKRSKRQDESRDERGAQLAAPPLPTLTMASVIAPTQDPGSAKRGRGRRGQDSGRQRSNNQKSSKQGNKRSNKKEAAEEEALPAPPRPAWQRVTSCKVRPEELETGHVVLGNLPTGPVFRLVLVVGSERYEGGTKFSIAKDTRVEVSLFPFTPGPGASFNYSAHPANLAADEAPAGVVWTQ
ncbi:MAG: hypothetical protein ACI9HE_002344 [Planctomycetota bacterium]|jgi:hypothetical protein